MFKLVVVGHPVFNHIVERSSEVDSSAKFLAALHNVDVKVYQVAKYLGDTVEKAHFINTVHPEQWSRTW